MNVIKVGDTVEVLDNVIFFPQLPIGTFGVVTNIEEYTEIEIKFKLGDRVVIQYVYCDDWWCHLAVVNEQHVIGIKVGDTIRVTNTKRFAEFVKKGDVAKVVSIDETVATIGIRMSSEHWERDQYISVKRYEEEFYRNTAITFLHHSQKLVDKPSE